MACDKVLVMSDGDDGQTCGGFLRRLWLLSGCCWYKSHAQGYISI